MRSASVTRIDRRRTHPLRRAGDLATAQVSDTKVVDTPAAGTALVDMTPTPRTASTSSYQTRPDASFVTHLIAMAEQTPQTRLLRRAEMADVDAMYRAANQNRATMPVGAFTRQTA